MSTLPQKPMLTLFACPKPFRNHEAVIQRNAITSWTKLEPRPQIFLLGDEEGTAEIAAELKLMHIPSVKRNEYGTPLLDDLFAQAQNAATTDLMAYVNADIILFDSFIQACTLAEKNFAAKFLLVGRRWDYDQPEILNFSGDWRTALQAAVYKVGLLHSPTGMDYFVFRRGMWKDLPSFALGRFLWDTWLFRSAKEAAIPVLNGSPHILAVHQNHEYPGGKAALINGPERARNEALYGGPADYFWTVSDADFVIHDENTLLPAESPLSTEPRFPNSPPFAPACSAQPKSISLLRRMKDCIKQYLS